MRQFPSGAAIVIYPSLNSRAVVANVLQELGAMRIAVAALPASVGQIEIRQAREVQDLTENDWGLGGMPKKGGLAVNDLAYYLYFVCFRFVF